MLKRIKWYTATVSLFASLGIILLLAFPAIRINDEIIFDGLDLADVGGAVEFKFSPSLDFYESSRITYRVNNVSSPDRAMSILADIYAQLDISDYEIKALENEAGELQLVTEVAMSETEARSMNQAFNYVNNLDISLQIPETDELENELDQETNPISNQTNLPEYQSLGVNTENIVRSLVVYGADYDGWGLKIDFNEAERSRLLALGFSDFNQSPESQLFLTSGGVALGAQRFAISSSSASPSLLVSTFLNTDYRATKLLAIGLEQGGLPIGLTQLEVSPVQARYTNSLEFIKLGLATTILAIVALLIWKYRFRGVLLSILLIYLLAGTIASLKIINASLFIITFLAITTGAVLQVIIARKYIFALIKNEIGNLPKLRVESAKQTLNLLIVVSGLHLIFAYVEIPAIQSFNLGFVITLFTGLAAHYLAIPGVNKLFISYLRSRNSEN